MTGTPTAIRHRGIWWTVVPIGAVGLVTALATWGLLGLYVFGQDGLHVRLLAKVFPFPVASVDGSVIRYDEWSGITRAFVSLAEQGKVSVPGSVSRHDIGRNVLNRLIQNRVLLDLARERGITVTEDEIDAHFRGVADDPGDRKTLGELLTALGWSEADVKERVVKPYLVGRRLQERLGSVAAADKALEEASAAAAIKVYVKF